MRRTALLTLSLPALLIASAAQAVTFYLHKSGSPVAVPGGTTTFLLDQSAPVAPAPVAESVSVPKTTTASFPTFIAPAFGAPATLGLDFEVVAHLSANLAMNGCAVVTATVERVDAAGVRGFLARGEAGATVPQGGGGGTVGFAPVTVRFVQPCSGPFEAAIGTGESIAVTVGVSNECNANRTVFLAYDAATAPSSATPRGPFPLPCKDELKCQTGASKALAKFVGAKAKCITKCEQGARKQPTPVNPATDCDPPFAGATATCVLDSLKGAEAKAAASIKKNCDEGRKPDSCPECVLVDYPDCNAWADARVAITEGLLDGFVPLLACNEYPPALTKLEAKCIDGTVKALAKFVASKDKCYDKCWANAVKYGTSPEGCVPPPPASNPIDPATNDCVNLAEGKAVAAAVKVCAAADPEAPGNVDATDSLPECWAAFDPTQVPAASTAFVVGFAETAVDVSLPLTYCGSPGGAFVAD